LRHEVDRADVEATDFRLDLGLRGQHYHLLLRMRRDHPPQHLHTVLAGEREIQEDEPVDARRGELEGPGAVVRRVDAVAVLGQGAVENEGRPGLAVDYQNPRHGFERNARSAGAPWPEDQVPT